MRLLKIAFNIIKVALLIVAILTIFSSYINYSMDSINPPMSLDVKELSKYTQPLRTHDHRNYCSSVAITHQDMQVTLTNRHCCESEGLAHPYRYVGDSLEEILYIDMQHDVCILSSSVESPITVATKEFKLLDKVLVMGYPRGEYLAPVTGYVVVKNILIGVYDGEMGVNMYPVNFVSTVTYGGNSGSPVFNESGEVVNLIFAGHPAIVTYGVSVPLKYIQKALDRFVLEGVY